AACLAVFVRPVYAALGRGIIFGDDLDLIERQPGDRGNEEGDGGEPDRGPWADQEAGRAGGFGDGRMRAWHGMIPTEGRSPVAERTGRSSMLPDADGRPDHLMRTSAHR